MSNFTPAWFKKGFFNESLFCDDFLSSHQLLYSNGAFFTPDGRMADPMPLRCEIFETMREYVGANLAKKVTNVVDVLKLAAQVEDFPPVTDRIALANGTPYLDGTFQEGKPEIVRNRLPVKYDPKAAQPVHWLRFLSDLLYPEDIPTVQEFIGYCLIPSNKGQRMMVIKGSGGEGKSQIGVVLSQLFGCNMKDGSKLDHFGQLIQFCKAARYHRGLAGAGGALDQDIAQHQRQRSLIGSQVDQSGEPVVPVGHHAVHDHDGHDGAAQRNDHFDEHRPLGGTVDLGGFQQLPGDVVLKEVADDDDIADRHDTGQEQRPHTAQQTGLLDDEVAMQSRRLHPVDAVHGFGRFPTSILQSKMSSCIYSCPACAYSVKGFNLRNFRLRELLFRYSKFQNQVHHSCRQFQRKL